MTHHTSERAAARAGLERLLAGDAEARHAALEPLAGGTHRRSWLVRFADGRRAVLRMPQRHSNALLDAETEARAMSAAADAGLAPAVIAVDAGHLLAEYKVGERWTAVDVRRAVNIERLATLLRALHALPTELPVFAAERIADRYLAELPRDVREPRAAEWGDELVALARRYDARYEPTAFCHNDLVAANVLDDGELALVDFEYASRAAPLLDIANVAAMNGLDRAEQREVLAAYRRSAPTAADLAELASIVRMVRLMAWFWALLGTASTGEPLLYAPYLAAFARDLQGDAR